MNHIVVSTIGSWLLGGGVDFEQKIETLATNLFVPVRNPYRGEGRLYSRYSRSQFHIAVKQPHIMEKPDLI